MSREFSQAVADEIAKKGATARPRHLYRIYLDDSTLYYTDHEEDYTFGGQAYTSRAVEHSAIKTYMADRADGCTISIDNVDKAMSAYMEYADFEGRRIEIDKVFLGLNNPADYIPLFRGEMDTPEDGEEWFTVKAGNINDRRESKSPWRRFGLRCNWDFCGAECGYNAGTKQTGTADSGELDGTTLVDAALPTRPDDYWVGATLRILSGTNKGESRIVTGYDDTLKELSVLPETAFSDPIDYTSEYVLECDKTKAACEGFGNLSQFDGFNEIAYRAAVHLHVAGMNLYLPPAEGGIPPSDVVIPLVYGEARISGTLVDMYWYPNYSNNIGYADRLYAFCEGEVEDICELYCNGRKVNTFNKYLGTSTQSFVWRNETKYYRRTALIQKDLPHNAEGTFNWGGDNSAVEAIIKGLKVQAYDASGAPLGVPAWSDNPAWCILDFIMNRSAVKTPAANVDFQVFYDAASACDALGYRLSLTVKKQEKDQKIIEKMLTACRGHLSYHGGKVGLHVEQAASPAFTFDDRTTVNDNDNIKPGSFKPYKKHLNDIPNRIIVKYIDEQVREKTAACDGWLPKAATSIPYKFNNKAFDASGTVYIGGEAVTYTGNTKDIDGTGELTGCSARQNDYLSGYPLYQGGQLMPELTAIYQDYGHQAKVGRVIEKKLDGTAIPTYRQAMDVAEWYGRQTVEGNEFCKLTGFIDSLALTPGDVVNVTHERRGWVNRQFRVIETAEKKDEEVQYTLQIYDPSFYPSTEPMPHDPRETTLPNPYETPAHVTNLMATHSTRTSLDGKVENLINVSFDEPTGDDLVFWKHALVIYTTDDWATTNIHGAFESGSAVLPIDAQTGLTYRIKAVSVSYSNVQADSSTAPEATVSLSVEALPPDVTELQLFGQSGTEFTGKDAKFTWQKSSQFEGDEFDSQTQQDLNAGGDGAKSYGWNVLNSDAADTIDVNTTNAGKLTIDCAAADVKIANAEFSAPFVYKELTGDFDIEISYTDNADEVHEEAGLCVRDPDASSGEDWINTEYRYSNSTLYVGNTINSVTTWSGTVAANNRFHRITRVGNVFTVYSRAAAGDAWVQRAQYSRADFGSTVQVGVHARTSNITGTYIAKFDYFRSYGFDQYFKDYVVELWSSSIKRRTEYVTDNLYTYSWEKNYEDHSGSPKRAFDIRVWARDKYNRMSSNYAALSISNPAPAVPGNIAVTGKSRAIEVVFDPSNESDAEGYLVYGSKTPGFTPGAGNLLYRGKNTMFRHEVGADTDTWYYKVAAYDSFDEDNLNYSGQYSDTASLVQTDELEDLLITARKIRDNAIQLASDDFRETFEDTVTDVLERWENYSGSGELSIETGGVSGGQFLRVGDNVGDDQAWLIGKRSIPFDENKVYIIKARVRRTAGSGALYVGVAGRNSDDTLWVNVSGSNSYANQHYFAAMTVSPPSAFTTYVGYFRGRAASGNGGQHDNANDPGTVHTDVAYIRPLVLVNHNAAAGTMEVDEVSIQSYEVASFGSALIAQAAIGTAAIADLAVAEGKIDNLAVTEGKIGNLAVTEGKIDNLAVTNAKINDLSADKINAGTLTGRTVRTSASNPKIQLTPTDLEAFNSNGDSTLKILSSDGSGRIGLAKVSPLVIATSHTGTGNVTNSFMGTDRWQAQKFQLSAGRIIDAIMFHTTSWWGTPSISIQTDSGGEPSGTLAHTDADATYAYMKDFSSQSEWDIVVPFKTPFYLSAGTYHVVFKASFFITYNVCYTNTNPYSNGHRLERYGSWTAYTSEDLRMEIRFKEPIEWDANGNIAFPKTITTEKVVVDEIVSDTVTSQGGDYGGIFGGSVGPVVLQTTGSTSAPTHSAAKGTLAVTDNGVLYINTSGSTTWQKVGAQ